MAGGPPFVFLQVTTDLGALPFPGFGKGGRRGCFVVFSSPCCPIRLDLGRAVFSGEVMAEAGPRPVLRSCYQASADWVAVHVLEFLDGGIGGHDTYSPECYLLANGKSGCGSGKSWGTGIVPPILFAPTTLPTVVERL